MTSKLSHVNRDSLLRETHSNACNTAFIPYSVLFNNVFKELKPFLSQNPFLTTTAAEYSLGTLTMTQRPHALFKLKHFVFILKHSFWNYSFNKETSITALPCPLCAVFTTRFVYEGQTHQLYWFATTSTAI